MVPITVYLIAGFIAFLLVALFSASRRSKKIIEILKKERLAILELLGKTEKKLKDIEAEKSKILHGIARLNSAEKAKNDFILSIVHQLKTSATSAKWSLMMFLSGDFGKINKEQKSVIERLYKKNDKLIFSTNDLLNTTKIEDNAYFFQKISADIQDVVQSVAVYFQDEIKSKKINFDFRTPAEKLPVMMLDKEKIRSVVENLFDNALKYTGEGGTIFVSLSKGEKNMSAEEVIFKIKDSGIGIPKEQQQKIFGKFFRANNANEVEASGSGIGLFLAKNIIEGHNGKIWFESEEGNGSTFYFTLPIEVVE